MSEREAPPDMDVLSLDSGDEGVMVGGKEDMFASAIGDPPQVVIVFRDVFVLKGIFFPAKRYGNVFFCYMELRRYLVLIESVSNIP